MMAFAFHVFKLSRSRCRTVYSGSHCTLKYLRLVNFHSSSHNRLVLSSVLKEKTLTLRPYSSGSTSSDPEDKPVKLSFGRRFLNALKLLALGSKLTITDAKKMFTLRREATKSGFDLLSGKAPPPEDVTITRAELSFIIQVRKDLSKCLPVVILFFIPFIGYIAVPLVLFYPHKVLSRQFLTPQMDKKYKQLDYDLRQKSANLLADKLCHRHDGLASLLSGSLTKDNFTNIHSMLQNTKELTFMEHYLLSSSLGHFPYLPGYFLRRRLQSHMSYLYMEDWLIELEGGVSKMSAEEVEKACYNRGLLADSDVLPSDLSERLDHWVQYSTSFSECPATTLAITTALATAMK